LSVELNVNGWLDKSDTQLGQVRAYLPVSGAPPLTPVTLQSATNLINYPYLTKDSNRIADWNAGRDFGRNDRFYQFATRVDYEATSSLRLVSVSSYSNLRVAAPVDADATPYSICPWTNAAASSPSRRSCGWKARSALDWMVGGNLPEIKPARFNTPHQRLELTGPHSCRTFITFDGIISQQ